ncbi:MAG: hypothetical protein ACYDGM_00760 [Vulcanimicrobiaceae bacterium]
MNKLSRLLAGAILAAGALSMSIPAAAQSMQGMQNVQAPYLDSRCGSWHDNTWVSNGNCTGPMMYRHQRIAGTIVAVSGHLVTVQQSTRRVVINDRPALNRQMSGHVAVGRQIVAHGYWRSGVFYATMIQ